MHRYARTGASSLAAWHGPWIRSPKVTTPVLRTERRPRARARWNDCAPHSATTAQPVTKSATITAQLAGNPNRLRSAHPAAAPVHSAASDAAQWS
jgi:hypothetical protein